MNSTEILARIQRGLDRLSERDVVLLSLDANERTLTHRLALYLETEFPDWNVDCEYNRDKHDAKRLDSVVTHDVSSSDTEAQTVFPDIIVHRRNSDANLLVIEAKKTTSRASPAADHEKLHAYVSQLGYEHAVFVLLATGGIGESTVHYVAPDV